MKLTPTQAGALKELAAHGYRHPNMGGGAAIGLDGRSHRNTMRTLRQLEALRLASEGYSHGIAGMHNSITFRITPAGTAALLETSQETR
jgi:hypothetical protein